MTQENNSSQFNDQAMAEAHKEALKFIAKDAAETTSMRANRKAIALRWLKR